MFLVRRRLKYIYKTCQKYQIGHNSIQGDISWHANSSGEKGTGKINVYLTFLLRNNKIAYHVKTTKHVILPEIIKKMA